MTDDDRRPPTDRADDVRGADERPAPSGMGPEREDRTEPLDRGLPSADELDEADGPMEAPADTFRSREEIEAVRRSEAEGSDPTRP